MSSRAGERLQRIAVWRSIPGFTFILATLVGSGIAMFATWPLRRELILYTPSLLMALRAMRWTEPWLEGRDGEREVATALEPLAADGYVRCDSLRIGAKRDIDHVLVGPGGVFVIDAKAWRGRVELAGSELRSGRVDRSGAVRAVRGQAAAVRHAIGEHATGREITAVLAFTRLVPVGGCRRGDRAWTIPHEDLPGFVRRQEQLAAAKLTSAQIGAIVEAVESMRVRPRRAWIGRLSHAPA